MSLNFKDVRQMIAYGSCDNVNSTHIITVKKKKDKREITISPRSNEQDRYTIMRIFDLCKLP